MSLGLLAPLGLVALLALGVPLLLHLIRRSELIDTAFAALRWIPARALPRRRLRVERPWLLLLRLLLLGLLALLLARLVLVDAAVAPYRDAIMVAPGADVASARAQLGAAAQWRWLAPGFPLLEAAPAPGPTATASLLRELDALAPAGARLRVVVPRTLDGLDGERPQLAHAIDWIVVDGSAPSAIAPATAAVRVHVRHADNADAALAYLRAALAAWNLREPARYTLDAQPLAAGLPADHGWLLWLGAAAPAALTSWVEQGGTALLAPVTATRGRVLWRDGDGRVLARVEARGAGRLITLPASLAPADLPWLLDADFPDRLLAALRGSPAAPTRAFAATSAPAVGGMAATGASAAALHGARALDGWLAWAIAVLFVLERLLATRRREGVRG